MNQDGRADPSVLPTSSPVSGGVMPPCTCWFSPTVWGKALFNQKLEALLRVVIVLFAEEDPLPKQSRCGAVWLHQPVCLPGPVRRCGPRGFPTSLSCLHLS